MWLAATAPAVLGLAIAASAHAQGAGASGGAGGAAQPAAASSANTVGEVVVTAQFREQNLQQTPLAITAVNAQMLEARSQTNLSDVAAQAPNVTLKPAGAAFGSAMVAFIRGVGQTDFNFSQEPGVGIYVDDVYYATLTGSLLDLLDVDRVEVLRGPQGTLAGRNSIGGAIKMYSKKPSGDTGGYIEGTYGSLNRIDFRGAADFAIVPDQLFLRISGATRHHDGYVTRVDYRCTHPNSPIRTFSVGTGCELGKDGGQAFNALRVALRWIPSTNFEVNLAADATNDQSPVQANTITYARENGLSLDGVPYSNIFVPYGPNSGDPNHPNDPYLSYATFIDPEGGPLEAGWKPVVVPPINYYRSWGVSGTIDWRLNDHVSIKSVTAYRRFYNSFAEDTPSSPIGVQLLLQTLHHRQLTQETRANINLFDKIDLTVGGFYADQNGNEEARVDLPYVGAGSIPGVRNFAFDFRHGPDLTPSTAKAGFAHADWHVTDRIDLIGGVRYSVDDKSYTFHRHNPDGTPVQCPVPNFVPGGCANWLIFGLDGQSASFHSTRWDYRGDLDFKVTDNLMVYGQVSTGYKGGGIDARPFFGKGAGCPDPDCQVKAFNPETLTSFEAGFKSQLFDRRVRFNAAAFFNKYNDIILTLSSCPNNSPGATPADRAAQPCALPVNAGRAHVKGFEFETEAHPIDGFEMDASLSYLDFKYTFVPDLDPATGRSTTTGISINGVTPFTPKWKWNFGAQYEIPFMGGGTLTPRVDVTYQSDIFTSPLNQPGDYDPAKQLVDVNQLTPNGGSLHVDRISAYTTVNARVTWRSPDRSWQAALEITNLTNKLYYLTLFDLAEGGLPGYTAGQPAQPREWAITIKKTF